MDDQELLEKAYEKLAMKIVHYAETKAEAKKAVEKLKAWEEKGE